MNDTLYNKAVALTYGYEQYIIYPDYSQTYGTIYYVAVGNNITYDNGIVYGDDTTYYMVYAQSGITYITTDRIPAIPSNRYYYGTVGLRSPAYSSVTNQFDAIDHNQLAMYASLALAFCVSVCYFVRLIWIKH